jgi:D-3-phosphoglycerate dehydrogenase / 2-oxoglutarate reductase
VTTFRVLITCPQLQRTIDDHRATFAAAGVEISVPPVVQQLTEAELIELLPEMDGIIVGDDPLTAGVLEQAPRLRIISKWGVGIDNIDLRAASERGIAVTNTPGMFGDEVADVVIGYLILLARHLDRIAAGVRAGGWPKVEGVSLSGRTLGIIGLGAIGRAVAVRGKALGMVVLGSEVLEVNAAAAERLGVIIVDREALIRRADVISLNCPLTAENRHMLDASALETAKRGAWIINTARGPLIDETALAAALHSGQIGAAALDVFEVEPLPLDSPLREFDNIVLGSHNASNTAEAVARTSARAIENLLRGLQGDR